MADLGAYGAALVAPGTQNISLTDGLLACQLLFQFRGVVHHKNEREIQEHLGGKRLWMEVVEVSFYSHQSLDEALQDSHDSL